MLHPCLPVVILALALAGTAPFAAAQTLIDEDTDQLLVQAVTTAVELDLYNARCRHDRSGRHADQLNRLLATRFRTTLVKVQDTLFPERSYRDVQERLQQDFLQRLREAGGCTGAKGTGLRDELSDRHKALMRKLEALP